MTFLKKSVFDPPNRQYLFSQAYLGDVTLSTYHFLTLSGPHAKSHQKLQSSFRDRKSFCTLDP